MTINVEQPMTHIPADWLAGPGQGNWTYNHYAALPEDGHRYEIVEGVLLHLTTPGIPHQEVVMELALHLLRLVVDSDLGKTFVLPVDVELSPKNVFEPDIVVVLKAGLHKITESHIIGAPDLVVEVASPGTAKYDRTTKRDAYALAGVSEYWLVDPILHTVEVLLLKDRVYQSNGVFSGKDVLISQVVPTIAEIPVEQFFI